MSYLWAPPGHYYAGLEPKDRVILANDVRANQIQVITTLVQALGGTALLIGIYFAWANLKTTQEGQITDRFTKAIDQLGAVDDKDDPKLELRLGGIYALERIARESEKDHWPIMEVLTTYVRVHAPVMEKTNVEGSGSNDATPRSNNANPPHNVPAAAPSPDIQAILTVIGRRELKFEKGTESLDLHNTDLAGAILYLGPSPRRPSWKCNFVSHSSVSERHVAAFDDRLEHNPKSVRNDG